MLNSKERATLRAKANKMPAIFHLGKGNITPEFVQGVRDALEARELIKIDILQNCEVVPTDAAQIIADRTKSEVVTVIGKRFVLYRKKKSDKKKSEEKRAAQKKMESKEFRGGRKNGKN